MSKIFLLIFLLCSSTAHANIREGLVGWWKFDEASGNAIDSSGQGNTGTPTGTTIVAGCARAGCRSFNGTSDFVSIANQSNFAFLLDSTKAWTVTAWVYPETTSRMDILVKGITFATGEFQLDISNDNSLGPEVLVTKDNGNYVLRGGATNTLKLNVWNCVTFTYNGSGYTSVTNFRIYQNGAEVSYTVGSVQGTPATISIVDPVTIGGNGRFFDGFIDDVRIYNRALTAQEVSDLYVSGVKIRGSANLHNARINN